MDGKILFYYFGDDEAFFRALGGEFKRHTKLLIQFKRFYESDEKKIQSLFLKVISDKPNCIFIDFSKNTQDYLHLARILARTNLQQEFVMVGMVDYLSSPDILKESIATGVNLSFIKSAEIYDVVYEVTKLVSPNEIQEHGFANATLNDDWTAGVPMKIGYVYPEGLHFETNYNLSQGDRLKLIHPWLDKIIPSKEVFIRNVSSRNLFYHFKHSVDAEFVFVDEFLPPEGMTPEEIEERKKEREELILHHRKALSQWINKNLIDSQEKKAKVLIIDPEFHFYNNRSRTDKHAYTVRCIDSLKDMEQEITHHEPQVIAYALDKADAPAPVNSQEKLLELMGILKGKFQELNAFVIVFNSKISSKEMKEQFSYSNIMSIDGELSVDLMQRMAEVYDKKLQETILKSKDKKAPKIQKVFMKKTNPASISEIVIPMTVVKLSETDMSFQTEKELPIGINLHISSPVDMYINVQPSKTQGKVPEYVGLIHSISESAKKDLRRFVNLVFFRDHDAQVQAESDEFKKLNETKLTEKLEALKVIEAEAQASQEATTQNQASEQPQAQPEVPPPQESSQNEVKEAVLEAQVSTGDDPKNQGAE